MLTYNTFGTCINTDRETLTGNLGNQFSKSDLTLILFVFICQDDFYVYEFPCCNTCLGHKRAKCTPTILSLLRVIEG